MRKALFFAVALALSASAAQAQGRDWNDDDDDRSWRDRREHRNDRGRERDDDDGWREERRGHLGGRGRGGARFFVRSGDTQLRVVCDPGEPMRTCVDAAVTLLDRARQAGPE